MRELSRRPFLENALVTPASLWRTTGCSSSVAIMRRSKFDPRFHSGYVIIIRLFQIGKQYCAHSVLVVDCDL